MKQKLLYLLTILAIAGFVLPQQVMAETYYVKPNADSDGSAWDKAIDLAEALNKAQSGDAIWVAKGTYVPKYIAGDEPSEDDRDKAFVIPAGVTVLGGFPEAGGTLEQRDWVANETILSGDIDTEENEEDEEAGTRDCYHVVIMASSENETTTLDGFTITGGKSKYNSGTITVNGESVYREYGAGIYAFGSVELSHNTIKENVAERTGGGIYWAAKAGSNSSFKLTHSIICNNKTLNNDGGGVYVENAGDGSAEMNYNLFYGNEAGSYGGAMHVEGATLNHNTIYKNNGTNNTSVYAIKTTLTNNIIWDGILDCSNSTLSYNLIGKLDDSGFKNDGTNLIGADYDPLFVNTDPDAGIYDFRLSPYSSAIGMGLIKGEGGADDQIVDMGVYPYTLKADKNGIVYVIDQEDVDTDIDNYSGNGSDWANGTSLNEALRFAADPANEVKQIWVAQGTYKPKYIADNKAIIKDDRDRSFVIPSGIQVYGGFKGEEETLDQRDWLTYETILSGDIDTEEGEVDEEGEKPGTRDCYHVVIMVSSEEETTTLDGFTITGGRANGQSSITVNGQSIRYNYGGGIYAEGSVELSHNTIYGNEASYGGGGICWWSDSNSEANNSFNLTYNTIYDNAGGDSSGQGGGAFVYNYHSENSQNVTLSHNLFYGNKSYYSSAIEVLNATLTHNTIYGGGGSRSDLVGAYYTTWINNILWWNGVDEEGEPIVGTLGSTDGTFSYNLIGNLDDYDFENDGTNLIGADCDPRFVNTDPNAGAYDFRLQAGSPAIGKGKDGVDMGAFPYNPDDTPKATTYHALTLELASGVNLYGITAGTHQIADGDHLFLQFLPEDPTLKAEDVMLLIDGVDTPFTVPAGNTYYGYILPVTGEHSIVIALREYTVTLPEVQGITYDVGAGMHRVAYGNSFTFRLTLADEINPADVHVFANGQEISPTNLPQGEVLRSEAREGASLSYTIDRVTTAVTVVIKGGSITSNASLTQGVRVIVESGKLKVENEMGTAVDVTVYSITGQNMVQLRGLRGSRTLTLPAGIYIVRAGQQSWKVMVND
ncbi:right-handed parallel beta-helix repeat-containing protein [Parabacteroides sp. PF5-6]|uniref:right-handed parallel beta-helix repeat-containing protein n=1 Tax=Parabacteroides sp. PF5-6 TaxID=1742403 RepID=UPI00240695B5|nr:right-handed parallel beta-helix repeat-containing protein [Parabacteroides sp. PF5-6]MDF9829246.1 hypothetical protein [Parabacteroides sp. PF5-6]